MQHLQPNTTLQSGKYRIEKVLGQGGFGITYLAEQTMLGRQVAIKEFFMKELCERDESTSHVTFGTEGSRETIGRFREKFLKEARNIARLNHPNIIGIIDIFEENGTAYYVMEYAANGSLADKVKLNGYLSEPVATNYDMSGNVFEWCSDWWDEYSATTQSNPTGPSNGKFRIFRGGSWFWGAMFQNNASLWFDGESCKVSNRFFATQTNKYPFVGLRLVLSE
ncbi:MAG: SUMF1/EgtB/PvdO family nonheme iron enzyme [Paludibacteraceae bacterium]|nr:SUMF1/EgtB/PvdO family nonheme iron enzyme [Paludibacteraceae bacterium]